MYRSRPQSAAYKYGGAFAWLVACTVLFVFLAPIVQVGTAALVRIVFGVQKIVYAAPLSKQSACSEGVRAYVAIPYDASVNAKSALVFDFSSETKNLTAGNVFLADGGSFLGTVQKNAMQFELDPVFASGKNLSVYTADKTLIQAVGKGNETLIAETPKQTVVSMGETITIAVGGRIHKVGTVVNIHDTPQSPMKQVVIKTTLSQNALQAVCVIAA